MFKRLMPTLAILAVASIAALAQTFAPNMPNIGGPAYCSSTVNAVCVNTVPAGPAVTGNETIPADTNATQGQQPQSGRFTLPALGGGTLDYSVPVTTNTVTAACTTRQVIVEPAGTIAALTLVTPASTCLVNGQRLGFCTTAIISTLTTTAGAGTTVSLAPTAMLVPVVTGAASCVEWIYRTANTTWYRVQ